MEAFLLLATPIIVSWATQQLKKLETINVSGNKASLLRGFALLLSFGGVVATSVATGQDIPIGEVTTYVTALLAFGATQVPYIYGKIK